MLDCLRKRAWAVLCGGALGALLIAPGSASAQENAGPPERAWSNEPERACVNASGNAGGRTFAAGDRVAYNWTYSESRFKVDCYRATTRQRFLFNEGGGVRQQLVTETTAELYDVALQFRRNFIGELFWYVGGSWYRNRFAGIENTYNGNGGVGLRFLETDATLVSGEIGLGVTREAQTQGLTRSFAVVRGAFEWKQTLTDTTDFEVGGEGLWSLSNTDDLRVNATAALTARISGQLAMRASYDVRFDNDPASILVDTVPGQVPARFVLATTDRTVGASLVLKV